MNFGRVHPGEWVASACGLLILVGLSYPWYGETTGFGNLSLLELILLLTGAGALVLPVILAVTRTTNIPVVFETLISTASVIVAFALFLKFIWTPDGGLRVGFYLGLAGAVLLSVVGWRSTSREQ